MYPYAAPIKEQLKQSVPNYDSWECGIVDLIEQGLITLETAELMPLHPQHQIEIDHDNYSAKTVKPKVTFYQGLHMAPTRWYQPDLDNLEVWHWYLDPKGDTLEYFVEKYYGVK